MASRGSTGFWIPTNASSTQIEEIGYTPASGFQDLAVRSLGVGGPASGTIGQIKGPTSSDLTILAAGTNNAVLQAGNTATRNGGYVKAWYGTDGRVECVPGTAIGANNTGGPLILSEGTGTGTGVGGTIAFYTSPVGLTGSGVNAAALTSTLTGTQKNLSGTNSLWKINPTFSGASPSGSNITLYLAPTINWSGAPTMTMADFQIDRTETALGTGLQNMILCRAGASGNTQVFAVDNTGAVTSTIGTTVKVALGHNNLNYAANATATDSGLWSTVRGRGTIASPSGVQSGDSLGRFAFGGYDSSAALHGQTGQIEAVAAETWGNGTAWGTNFTVATTAIGSGATPVKQWAFMNGGGLVGNSANVLGWSSSSTDPTVAADTGASRLAANSWALGNGTAADRSGLLSISGLGFGTGTAAAGQIVGSGSTVTTSTPVLNLSQTWNSGGTVFTGAVINITNTASANASKLLDIQLGGVSTFYVTSGTGTTTTVATASGTPIVTGSARRLITVFDTTTHAQGTGASFGLGGYNNGVTNPTAFADVGGYKENATAGNSAGYLSFSTSGSGGVIAEWARISSTGLIQFGGTSSSFPALGRSTTFLTVGLADGTSGGGLGFGSTGVVGWTAGAPSSTLDTGISRTAAATLAIGNGTQGDTSGTLAASIFQNASTIATSTWAISVGSQFLGSAKAIKWVSTANVDGSVDANLSRRGAAGAVGLSNGLNPCTLQIYNTTDADVGAGTNFERFETLWSANVCYLRTIAGGTGTARQLDVGTQGASNLNFTTGNIRRWTIDGNGGFLGLVAASKISQYASVNTAGWGVPAIYASGRLTGQTGAVASVAAYTVGAADGSFEVSANVLVTTSTTHSFTVQVAYTDESNVARTGTTFFESPGLPGALAQSITNTSGANAYRGLVSRIRAKAATAITVSTSGTFATVTYNVEADIKQVS